MKDRSQNGEEQMKIEIGQHHRYRLCDMAMMQIEM
jgi:hypothetical protein